MSLQNHFEIDFTLTHLEVYLTKAKLNPILSNISVDAINHVPASSGKSKMKLVTSIRLSG